MARKADTAWAAGASMILHALLILILNSTSTFDFLVGPQMRFDILWLSPEDTLQPPLPPSSLINERSPAGVPAKAAADPQAVKSEDLAADSDRQKSEFRTPSHRAQQAAAGDESADDLAMALPAPVKDKAHKAAPKEPAYLPPAHEPGAKEARATHLAQTTSTLTPDSAHATVRPTVPPAQQAITSAKPSPVPAPQKIVPVATTPNTVATSLAQHAAGKKGIFPPSPTRVGLPKRQVQSTPPLPMAAQKVQSATQSPVQVARVKAQPVAAAPLTVANAGFVTKASSQGTPKSGVEAGTRKEVPASPQTHPITPTPATITVKEHAKGDQPVKEQQPKGLVIAPLRGDIKMVMTGDSGIRLSVIFREFAKSRRNRVLSRAESRREQRVMPVVAKTREKTKEAVIETAREGIYIFTAEAEKGPVKVTFSLKLFEGSPREKVAAIGSRTVDGKTVVAKLLIPEGILWDDDAAFTGSLEDSDSVTKFNAQTGVYWKEYND